MAAAFLELVSASASASTVCSANHKPVGSARGGPSGNDGFGGAAAAEGDHRRAARLRFDRHDAEIFFAGKEQGAAAAQMIADDALSGCQPRKWTVGPARRTKRASSCPVPMRTSCRRSALHAWMARSSRL